DQPGAAERSMVVLLFGAMIFYYFSALVSVFRVRASLRQATLRSGEAQKMNAIGQLTRGVAHDFNNILTVVLGNLELYHEVDDPEDKDRLAEEARLAAERASVLTAQLVAFARQSTLVPVAIKLPQFLHQFSQMVERVMPSDVDFKYSVPRGVADIFVDKSLFEMALLNLVLNGRDAMPNGGRLRVTAQPLTVGSTSRFALQEGLPTGHYVQVMVSDTGVGIPLLIQSRVFDPFFTTKKVGHGSGLGLSMAKGFAEQSSGALLMDSRPDVGTIFSFVLPCAQSVAVSNPGPSAQTTTPSDPGTAAPHAAAQ
ncbi:MAG: ATP-binding protein, partial [Pseudomonadota bacterium]